MEINYNKYWSLFFIILLVACTEAHEIRPATFSLMLSGEESKSWRQASFTFVFDDPDVDDIDANFIYRIPECSLDDIYTFIREAKQVEVYQGDDKCDPEGDDLLFRTSWDIVNANATFFLGGGDPFILSKLTDDSLVYGFRDTLVAPLTNQVFADFPGEARWVYLPIN